MTSLAPDILMVSALKGFAIVKRMAYQLPKVQRHICPVARPCSPGKTLQTCFGARSSCGPIPTVRSVYLCCLSIAFQSSRVQFQTNGVSAPKNGDSGRKIPRRCYITAWVLCHYHKLDTWVRHGVSLAIRYRFYDRQIGISVIFYTFGPLSLKAFFASSRKP